MATTYQSGLNQDVSDSRSVAPELGATAWSLGEKVARRFKMSRKTLDAEQQQLGGRTDLILGVVLCAQLFSLIVSLRGGYQQQVPHIPLIFAAVALAVYAVMLSSRSQAAEAESVEAEGRRFDLANFVADLVWETDVNGVIVFEGGRLLPDLLSCDRPSLIGLHYRAVVTLSEAELTRMMAALGSAEAYSDVQSEVIGGDRGKITISMNAAPRFTQDGTICGYIGVATDVTDRVALQNEIMHMAEHDALTGLANRRAFKRRLEQDINANQGPVGLAVYAIDLDGFKQINDTYGHDVGDMLLVQAAQRMRGITRTTDWCARLGGDEFVLVAGDVTNANEANAIARRLVCTLAAPYNIGRLSLKVPASIGIARSPYHSTHAARLMKFADIALYRAKSTFKGECIMFDQMIDGEVLYKCESRLATQT